MSKPHGFRPRVHAARSLGLALLCGLAMAVTAAGQAALENVYAYTFEHQPAAEAMVLIRSLLSPTGTVELQEDGKTIVARDRPEILARVDEMLERFDHPSRALHLDIYLLRAGAGVAEGATPAPENVVRLLRQHLRYDRYELLGAVGVPANEGQAVTYALGDDFDVSFRLGTVLAGQKLRVHDFRVARRPGPVARSANKSRQPEARELVYTNLNLWRDKQFAMVLSQDRASEAALMVAITFRPEDP